MTSRLTCSTRRGKIAIDCKEWSTICWISLASNPDVSSYTLCLEKSPLLSPRHSTQTGRKRMLKESTSKPRVPCPTRAYWPITSASDMYFRILSVTPYDTRPRAATSHSARRSSTAPCALRSPTPVWESPRSIKSESLKSFFGCRNRDPRGQGSASISPKRLCAVMEARSASRANREKEVYFGLPCPNRPTARKEPGRTDRTFDASLVTFATARKAGVKFVQVSYFFRFRHSVDASMPRIAAASSSVEVRAI